MRELKTIIDDIAAIASHSIRADDGNVALIVIAARRGEDNSDWIRTAVASNCDADAARLLMQHIVEAGPQPTVPMVMQEH